MNLNPEDPNPGLLLDLLSDDLIAQCLEHLDKKDLATAELVCHRFQEIVQEKWLWNSLCERIHPNLPRVDCSGAYYLPFLLEGSNRRPERLSTIAYKRLCKDHTNPNAAPSLLSEALAATSTDQPAEALRHVLNPASRRRLPNGDVAFYWSSTGSEDVDSCESITFRLAHSACLVTAVELRPFKAFFQTPRRPVYAPKRIRIRLGGIQCYTLDGNPRPLQDVIREAETDIRSEDAHRAAQGGAGEVPRGSGFAHSPASPSAMTLSKFGQLEEQEDAGQWVGESWISKEYSFEKIDELQLFEIPPTICLGGYLRIDLIGRTETQDADDRYYTCMSYARCIGKPLYNFISHPDGDLTKPSILKFTQNDPLVVHGGLGSVSERGWNPQEVNALGAGGAELAMWAQALGPDAGALLAVMQGIHLPLLGEVEEGDEEEEPGDDEMALDDLEEELHLLDAGILAEQQVDWQQWVGDGSMSAGTSSDSE